MSKTFIASRAYKFITFMTISYMLISLFNRKKTLITFFMRAWMLFELIREMVSNMEEQLRYIIKAFSARVMRAFVFVLCHLVTEIIIIQGLHMLFGSF